MHVGRRDILLSLILFGSTFLVFGETCSNGFTNWDDPDYVAENRRVLSGLSRENAKWAFTTFHAGNWHPLTWLSLQLDAQLFETRPWGFHLTNVLLHAANTLLLYWAMRFMTGAFWQSGLVALFFAFHPLHVESVAWIAERKDVLCTFFWMSTCLAYGWYARRPSWNRYLLTLAAFAAGLLAKPMLVTLPFVLLLLDYWPLGRYRGGKTEDRGQKTENRRQNSQNRKRKTENKEPGTKNAGLASVLCPLPYVLRRFGSLLVEKVPFLLLAAASCAITVYAQHHGGAIRTLEQCPFSMRVSNALVAYCSYIGQTLWPANLGLFYPHPCVLQAQELSSGIPSWQVVGAAVALILATALVCAIGRAFPYLTVGWLWFLGTLVPVIGLVQVGEAGRADRYTYIPLVGLFIAAVWVVVDFSARWRAQRIAAGLGTFVLLSCMILTWGQLQYWRSEEMLWEHTLEACGDSTAAHTHLGVALLKEKRFEEAERQFRKTLELDRNDPYALHDLGTALMGQEKIGEAAAQYRAAVRKYPHFDRPHYSLGMALADLGQRREAMVELEEALRLNPGFAAAHRRLGLILAAEGRTNEAVNHLRAAIEGGLVDLSVYYELARIFALQGKYREAIETLDRALAIEPADWRLRSLLGLALYKSGDRTAAAEQYREASRLNPGWPRILSQKAWILATHPDPKMRNGNQSIQLAEQACQATANRDARYLDTLAAAHAEAGNFPRAVETAKHALATAEADGKEDLAQEIQGRLKLYEQGKPFQSAGSPTN
jgi:protein O-mannosyl-transferase